MRRLLSLVVLAVLLLAGQAAAKGGHGHGEGGDGHDGKEGKHHPHAGHADKAERQEKQKEHEAERGDGHAVPHRDASPARPAAPHPVTVATVPPDAAVRVIATPLPGRLQFTFVTVAAAGGDVRLAATLPDLGGPWSLAGPGASACTVQGLAIDCPFTGLTAGDAELVQAVADLGAAPAWEPTAQAQVALAGDAQPGNDAGSASAGVLLG